MDRKAKIEYLKNLAAGKLQPADLLKLLPVKDEFWVKTPNGGFSGQGMVLTREELDKYRSPYPGPIQRTVFSIVRRSANKCANDKTQTDISS